MTPTWHTKRLGEVATLQRGFDLPTRDRVPGAFPLVSSSGISDSHFKCAVKGPGVVTGRSGSIGNVFFVDEDFWPLNTVLYVKDFHGNDPRFVFYLLTGFDLNRFASGAGVPTLNRNFVHDELVNVPALTEQHRIVGILDKAYAAIDAAKANTEKNLRNARAVFERRLDAIFSEGGRGWSAVKFGDIVESTLIGLTRSIREQGDNRPYKYVKMNNITSDNRFDFSEFVTVDASEEEAHRFALLPGDFLFNTRNSVELVGKSCIYAGNPNEVVLFNNNIMRVRFKKCVEPSFVLLAFSSSGVAQELNALKSGTTNVAAVYYGRLKSLALRLPPHNEQKRITHDLERFREEGRRLEAVYARKLALLDALKKSALREAFAGAL